MMTITVPGQVSSPPSQLETLRSVIAQILILQNINRYQMVANRETN